MKHVVRVVIMAAMLLILAVPVEAAGKKARLNTTLITMSVGTKTKLKLMKYKKLSKKQLKKVKWTSSNKKVATVKGSGKYKQNATITAKASGNATIKLKYNGKTYRCKLTVNQKDKRNQKGDATDDEDEEDDEDTPEKKNNTTVAYDNTQVVAVNISIPKDATVNGYSVSMQLGDTVQLSATVYPETAINKTVTWESDKEDIVTVDQNGLITGHAIGGANVTAWSADHKKKSKVYVYVGRKRATISLYPTELTIKQGETAQLTAFVNGKEANGDVIWKTSAGVGNDDNGQIHGRTEGEGVVTVQYKDQDGFSYYANCKVTVEAVPYEAQYSYKVFTVIKPQTVDSFNNINMNGLLYVKTDNPNSSSIDLCFYDEGGNVVPKTQSYACYDDIVYESTTDRFTKVEGGYICRVGLKKAGNMSVKIKEQPYPLEDTTRCAMVDVSAMVEIVQSETDEEYEKHYTDIINKVTTDSMNVHEKMLAISKYLKSTCTYPLYYENENGGIRHLSLVMKKHWYEGGSIDSCAAPALLEKFGELIGYDVKSMYHAYPMDSKEWWQWHYLAKGVYNGTTYYYDACPAGGPVSKEYFDEYVKSIPKLDFSIYK